MVLPNQGIEFKEKTPFLQRLSFKRVWNELHIFLNINLEKYQRQDLLSCIVANFDRKTKFVCSPSRGSISRVLS